MKLLLFLLLIPCQLAAGELQDRFNHQEILENGFEDVEWHKRKSERKQNKVEIGFEKAVSCRFCPAYSIILDSKGKYRYEGLYKAKTKGVIEGKISKRTADKLFTYVETIGYFSLRSRYSYPVTHASRHYTYVKLGDKSKVILNYMNQAPAAVWGLELMLDQIIHTHITKERSRPVSSYSVIR